MKKIQTDIQNPVRARGIADNEGEIHEDQEESKKPKQTPQAMMIHDKAAKKASPIHSRRNNFQFEGKTANKSPKGELAVLKMPHLVDQGKAKKMHFSPQPIKDKGTEQFTKVGSMTKTKYDIPSHPDIKTGAKIGKQTSGSPRSRTNAKPFEAEEQLVLKAYARKKKMLNQDLWSAAANGDLKKIEALLSPPKNGEDRADINSKGIEHRTALHWAVYENKPEAVKLLALFSASLEAKNDKNRTPLHIACILGEYGICDILLEAGASPNSLDMYNNTPVHYTSYYKNVKILQLLLAKKPDITIKNKKGQTPIDVTSSKTIISLFWNYLAGNMELKKDKKGELALPTEKHESEKKTPSAEITLKLSDKKPPAKIECVKKIERDTQSPGRAEKALFPKKWGSGNTSISSTGGEPDKVGLHSFTPIQLLGKGSFGEVYLVQSKASSKYYAMKILLKSKILGQNLTKYAYTEKNVLSLLHHPFIVSLHCSFQNKERLFLILDFCPGGDLGHALQKDKKFTEDRARIYLAEVLLALEELHYREIIYRDLKPDNVVLDVDGHALLTDFGLSKEGIKDNDYTQSFCGSVAYLAPEMLRRSGHGKSVDWYLLGVLLYEMLVGVPPYFNKSKEKLFDNIKRGPLQIPAGMSEMALDLIVKLLNRDPKHRLGAGPQDAEEIKIHPFFKKINWDDAKNRLLKPPKPTLKPIVHMLSTPDVFADTFSQDAEDVKLQKWTFISPEFK